MSLISRYLDLFEKKHGHRYTWMEERRIIHSARGNRIRKGGRFRVRRQGRKLFFERQRERLRVSGWEQRIILSLWNGEPAVFAGGSPVRLGREAVEHFDTVSGLDLLNAKLSDL